MRSEIFFPPNVIMKIFSNLRPHEICRCARVSKSWRSVAYLANDNREAEVENAWLNKDLEPKIVGEIKFEDFESLWFEGNVLAVCGKGFFKFWHLDLDKAIDARVGSKTFLFLNSFDGNFVTGDDEGYITAWDPSDGNDLFSIEAHGMGVSCLEKNGNYLVSGGLDSMIKLWRKPKRRGGLKCKVLKGHTARVNVIEFSIDEKRLFSGSDDTTIRVWDVASRACINVLKCNDQVIDLWVLSENEVSCACGVDEMLNVFEISSGTVQRRVAKDPKIEAADSVSYLEVNIAEDGTVKMWKDSKLLREFHLNTDAEGVIVHYDRFCVISSCGKVLVWDSLK